jgi:hypothetical protein
MTGCSAVAGSSGITAADAASVCLTLGQGALMEIQSSRFGVLNVDEQRIIQFPQGLLGFPSHKRFALIQTGPEKCFFWLQCADEPNLAFVVADPRSFSRTTTCRSGRKP